jgi:type IV secretory pathway VirB2 component (pilin)
MKGRILSRSSLLVPTLIGAAISVTLPNTARAAAANGGQPLPWEGPLNQVLASFTGPVAKALCILAIVVIGFGFAFSEGGGLRRILGLLLGVSIAVTATSFGVTFFGFDGGAAW